MRTPRQFSLRRTSVKLERSKSLRSLDLQSLIEAPSPGGTEDITVASTCASSEQGFIRGDSKEVALEYVHEIILEQIVKVQTTERLMDRTKLLCQARGEGGTKLAAALAQTQLRNQQARLDQLSLNITRLNRLVREIERCSDDVYFDYKDRVTTIVDSKPRRYSVTKEMNINDLSQSLGQLLIEFTEDEQEKDTTLEKPQLLEI